MVTTVNVYETLVQELTSIDQTGALRVRSPRFATSVFFIDDSIVCVRTNDPACEPGRFFLRDGLLDEMLLSMTRQLLGSAGASLEEVLIGSGAVDLNSLERSRERLALEVLAALALETELEWTFEPDVLPEDGLADLALGRELVAEELARRMPLRANLLEIMERRDDVACRVGTPSRRTYVDERILLERLHRPGSLEELCIQSGLGRFRTLQAIDGLLREDVIRLQPVVQEAQPPSAATQPRTTPGKAPVPGAQLTPAPQRPAAPGERWVDEGRLLMESRDYFAGLAAFREALRTRPEDNRYASLVRGAEWVCCAAIYAETFPPGSRFVARLPRTHLANQRITPRQRQLLLRLGRSSDVRTAVKSMPANELECLVAMKELVDKGYVASTQRRR